MMITPGRTNGTLWSSIQVFGRLICLVAATLCIGHVIFSTGSAEAQNREMRLSLREATAFALQGNLDIRITALDPRIREAQVTEEKGIFDVEGQAAFTASNSQLVETSTTFQELVEDSSGRDLLRQDNSKEQELSFGISQLTP